MMIVEAAHATRCEYYYLLVALSSAGALTNKVDVLRVPHAIRTDQPNLKFDSFKIFLILCNMSERVNFMNLDSDKS